MADTQGKPLTLREQILALPKADLNDPAEIATRAKWKEEEAAVNALLPRYEEIGRRIANGETVEIGSDLPGAAAVVYGLTGGKEGKPPTGEKQTHAAFLLAIFLRGAYQRRLAERYLEETGCTLQQARRVRVMRAGMVGPGLEELSEETRTEFFRADELLLDLAEYCDTLAATTPGARDGVPVSTNFSEEDVTEARELVERELDNGTADTPGTWVTSADRLQGSFMEHSAARKAADIYLQVRPSGKPVTLGEVEAAIVRFLSATTADPANPPATPREWLVKQKRGSELQALEDGIFLLAQEANERELEAAKRATAEAEERATEAERKLAEIQHKPLRIGTRAVKTHTARKSDFVAALRTLRQSKSITASTRKLLEREELIALRGDELLVSAGLLEIARQGGALQLYGPARARMGAVVFDARIVVEEPPLEQFARLIGFKAAAGGRVPSADRERVQAAMSRLCDDVRPIVVESTVMHGKKRHTEFEIVRDVPVRRNTRADGSRVLEIHGSLALGYWWGHVLLSPQKWEEARQAIGARYTDDAMKWADVYFRRLVIGVASEHKRKSTPAAELAAGLPKRLKAAALLEELQLEDYRAKKGPKDTAARLAKTFDFCVATGSLVSWEPDGAAYYRVTLPHPVGIESEDARVVQAEIFPMLAAGEAVATEGV